jgi:uncharacterized cupredoxin-like copper-binding protein
VTVRIWPAIALSSALMACAGTPTYAALPSDPGRVVRIDMSDFAFSPASISVTPGERITLSFRNVGTQEHEFMAGHDATPGKGFAHDWLDLAKVDRLGGHESGHSGVGLRLAPRGAANLTIVVPAQAGEVEFGCFVVGHYESGMKGTLVVTPSGEATSRTTAPSTGAPLRSPIPTPTSTAQPAGSMGDDDHGH